MLGAATLVFALTQAPATLQTVEELRAVFEAAPNDPDHALALGVALARLGARAEALAILEQARRLAPTEAMPWVASALVLRDENRQKDAAALLEQALSRGVATAEVYEELGFLLLSLGALERAREIGREGLARFPGSARLEMILGISLASSRDHAGEAATLLARAIEGGAPDPARLHRELGSVLVVLGRPDEGIDHLRRAVALEPDSPEARFRLANALRAVSDIVGASEELAKFQELQRQEEASEIEERKLRTDLNEAQRLALSNRLLASLEKLRAIVGEHPDDPRARVLRAKVLSSLGRDEEALSSITAAQRLATSNVESLVLEGRFLLKLGRFEAASRALRNALTLDSRLPEAHELLGVVEANLERHESAVAHFERARELGSDSDGLHLNLSESLRKLGRSEEAERLLEAYRKR